MTHSPVICAIDTTDIHAAEALVNSLRHHVGMIKLGLEFFVAHGAEGVRRITGLDVPVFLDLKFHDIPNTVAGAVRAAILPGVAMLTVHASGGASMLRAAIEAAKEESSRKNIPCPAIVGVTVLTSMDANDLNSIGINAAPHQHVLRLATLAQDTGLNGIVCSAHELEAVVAACGKEFITVVPGIRPATAGKGDQKRVMTPEEALQKGAHYLVIGRPITQAENPVEAASAIVASL